MKPGWKRINLMNSEHNFTELEHFTWCAQVAWSLAVADKKIHSDMDRHRFLMAWLKTAQKQKRFPRTVARDIDYLIVYGTRHGFASKLADKIEFMHRSCGDVAQQPDLFRLTYVTELLKDRAWSVQMQSERDWQREKHAPTGCTLSLRDTLSAQFDDEGWLTTPVPLRLWGDSLETAIHLFTQYHLKLTPRTCRHNMMELDIVRSE